MPDGHLDYRFPDDDDRIVVGDLGTAWSSWLLCFGREDLVLMDQGGRAALSAGLRAGLVTELGIQVEGALAKTADDELSAYLQEALARAKTSLVVPDRLVTRVRVHRTMWAHQLIVTLPLGDRTFRFSHRGDADAVTAMLAPRYGARFRVTKSAIYALLWRYARFLTK